MVTNIEFFWDGQIWGTVFSGGLKAPRGRPAIGSYSSRISVSWWWPPAPLADQRPLRAATRLEVTKKNALVTNGRFLSEDEQIPTLSGTKYGLVGYSLHRIYIPQIEFQCYSFIIRMRNYRDPDLSIRIMAWNQSLFVLWPRVSGFMAQHLWENLFWASCFKIHQGGCQSCSNGSFPLKRKGDLLTCHVNIARRLFFFSLARYSHLSFCWLAYFRTISMPDIIRVSRNISLLQICMVTEKNIQLLDHGWYRQ